MTMLPLLVLSTVLTPGGQLPLHVAQARDVSLLSDLVTNQETRSPEFGVVGSSGRRGELFGFGTVARLVAMSTEDDHEYAALALGGQRFRLDRVAAEATTPYLMGEVTCLEETDGDAGLEGLDHLAARVRSELSAYLAQSRTSATLSEDPWSLSHEVGSALRLERRDRQHLLSCPDTVARLRLGGELVRREQHLLTTFGAIPALDLPDPLAN